MRASRVVRSYDGNRYLCILFNADLTCVDAPAAPVFDGCFGIDLHIGVTLDRHISGHSGGNVTADSDSIITTSGYIDHELAVVAAVCGDGDVAFLSAHIDTRSCSCSSVDGNFVVADQFDGQVLPLISVERDRATFVALQRQRAGVGIIVGVVVCVAAGEAAGIIIVFVIKLTWT